jgi:hypothetical protein
MDWTVIPSLERTLNQGLAHLSKEVAVRKIQQFLKRQIADRDAEFIGGVEQQVGDSPRVEGWRIGHQRFPPSMIAVTRRWPGWYFERRHANKTPNGIGDLQSRHALMHRTRSTLPT